MINTAVTTTTIVAALWAASPPAPVLVAGPDSPRKVHIEVDATELGPDGTGMHRPIMDTFVPKLEAAGYEVVDEAEDAIDLRVRFEALRLEKFDYGIHFEFVEGEQVDVAIPWVACLGCMDANLLPLLDESAPALIDALESRADADSAAESGEPPDGGDDDPPQEPMVKPIGPIGYTGIGVAALGLGALVWGAVDLGRGRVYDGGSEPGLDTRRAGTDFSPRGRALLGAGIAGVAVGGALLITDIVIRSKKRKRPRQQTGTLIPVLAPQHAGLGWVQRF